MMEWRLKIITLGIVIRLLLNFSEASRFQNHAWVKLSGTLSIVSQDNTKCISRMGGFWINFSGWCKFSQDEQISVIGKVDRGVIDIFWGRNWLSDAVIDVIPNKPNVVVNNVG